MIEMTIEESRALTVAINSLRFNPDLSDIETQSHEIVLSNMRNRMQEGKKNEPLTLEELRKMDGEPVWAELADGRREYGLVCVTEFDEMIFIHLRNDVFLAFNHDVPNKPFWSNLYRRKPERETLRNWRMGNDSGKD